MELINQIFKFISYKGLKQRKRKCSRKKSDTALIDLDNDDWLCDKSNEKIQIDDCSMPKCSMYSEWSNWSSCSKLCSGTRSRRRSCSPIYATNELCNQAYLFESQPCSLLENCQAANISNLFFF